MKRIYDEGDGGGVRGRVVGWWFAPTGCGQACCLKQRDLVRTRTRTDINPEPKTLVRQGMVRVLPRKQK
jgi:hypothetical protein